jgi:hypothetical protein
MKWLCLATHRGTRDGKLHEIILNVGNGNNSCLAQSCALEEIQTIRKKKYIKRIK